MPQAGRGLKLSGAVLDAVADAKGVDPTELNPPLSAVVNADALDDLFVDTGGEAGRIVFEYSGCEVTVESDRTVEVRRRPSDEQTN